ncbi:hypothetical protein ACQEVB_01830 [Pseudonocardia sp. CA-107938]|uniref:hypothetical protein n=1 Tax=Pseudonocardia sp. CA-107938 TaxID=3240021 RepID=UPI003D8FAB19
MAVLDRPDSDEPESSAPRIPAPRAGAGIVRLPAPEPVDEFPGEFIDVTTGELEAMFAEPSAPGPTPAGLFEPAAPPDEAPEQQRRGRRLGTTAVAIAGGALSILTATVPVDAFAGYGAAALTADASTDSAEASTTGAATDALPPVADPGGIAAAVAQAHQQVTDQITAAEAGLEVARQKAEAERAAAAEKAKAEAAVATQRNCGVSEAGLGPVKPFVRTAAQLLGCKFGKPTMYGVAGRGGVSDHPGGKAVDFMVNRSTGDALAACALKNKAALGITYVIWRQRINFGQGWQGMEDRGGVTANHYDHVHVSFGNGASGTSLQGCG